MPKDNLEKLLEGFIKLSVPTTCPNCEKTTKLIGERAATGNWWCPFCVQFFPYAEFPGIETEVPFTKLTTQLEPSLLQTAAPLGLPGDDFPMDLATGFLVPSYTHKIRRKRNILLATAIDFTRYGRIKSGTIWQYDLQFNERDLSEFETLASFVDTQGYHLPFNYTDPVRGTSHVMYFDSDVEGEAEPVNTISFGVRITE